MQPSEISGLHYLVTQNPNPNSAYFSLTDNNVSELSYNQYSNPLYNFNIHPQVQELSLQSPCFSNNSTSDEADEQQHNVVNERRQRRMISNRESARRSRMRKQRHLDELLSQVNWLRNKNHQLIDKLNQVSESHDQVLQENVQLKEEASELRQLITDMQLEKASSTLRDMEDTPHLRTGFSSQSITSSEDIVG